MQYLVQHRRGTTEEWIAKADLVPRDGEIVIEKCADGYTRLKIGDGVNTFAHLPYLNMPGAALVTRRVVIELRSDSWIEDGDVFYQTITIADITENSKVDLQLTPSQLVWTQDEEIAFTTKNDNGIVTVYAIGGKPLSDFTEESELGAMQATISETTRE
jgi:hypothetical protein